jgi:Spy/CpxP family protein refolding chaperone
MLKQCLLVLVAAGIISIAAPAVVAQESPSNDQGNSMGQGHRHGPDPAQRTQELTKRLKLNTDQQAKVKEALESQHSQMESLHQDSSLSQDDRRAKMMDIRKGTDTQIRGVLDQDQQKKWDEMQAKRGQWMHDHHGPPDAGSDQAPPPPQK